MKRKILQILGILSWAVALSALYYFATSSNTLISQLKLKTSDVLLRYKYNASKPISEKNRFVVIDLDQKSLDIISKRETFNRGLWAKLLSNLYSEQSKPAIIGIDTIFIGKSSEPHYDQALANTFKEKNNIIIGSYFNEDGKLVFPDEIFKENTLDTGFINLPRDYDLTIRRGYAFKIDSSGKIIDHSLPFKMFAYYKGISLKSLRYNATSSKIIYPSSTAFVHIPIDKQFKTIRIDFTTKLKDLTVFPFWRVLYGEIPPSEFKDKIVFIGSTVELYHDIHSSPFGLMSGMVINANFLLTILLNRYIQEIPQKVFFSILFLFALFISVISKRISNFKTLFITILLIAFTFYAALILIKRNILIDYFGIGLVCGICFIGIASFKALVTSLENRRLRILAITDGLTGLYVFRFFEAKLKHEIEKAKQNKYALSLVIFDIDDFKHINDTYGHDLGNEVLKQFALILRNNSRPSDTLCRFGGDEFTAILSNTTFNNAVKYAEKIKNIIVNIQIHWQDKTIKFTTSIGVTCLNSLRDKDYNSIVKAADRALYQAKSSGKNKVGIEN